MHLCMPQLERYPDQEYAFGIFFTFVSTLYILIAETCLYFFTLCLFNLRTKIKTECEIYIVHKQLCLMWIFPWNKRKFHTKLYVKITWSSLHGYFTWYTVGSVTFFWVVEDWLNLLPLYIETDNPWTLTLITESADLWPVNKICM